MTLSGGSIALALFGTSSSTSATGSIGSGFPGGPIAYYNYLAKSGPALLAQSNKSTAVAGAVAYFQSKVALTTPAKATSLVKVSANLPSTDAAGTKRTIVTPVFDSEGNKFNVTLTFIADGSNQWSASATKIVSASTNPNNQVKASVTSGFQVINFDPITGAIIPVTTGSNPTSGMSLGVFSTTGGGTLAPKFSFSGGGTVGGNLTDTAGGFITTAIQANGNAPVPGPNNITSVDQIFKDPKLLNFILTATGLGDQTQNIGLVKKALTQDPSTKTAIVNSLPNSKFKTADQDLQLYKGLTNLQDPATLQALITSYQTNTFEQGVATTDQNVANARYFAKNIAATVKSASTNTNAIFSILGDSVMRDVVTTALGFPKQLAVLPVNDQAAAISKRLNVQQFSNPTFVSQFVTRYLTQVQTAAFQADLGSSTDVALSTLTGINTNSSNFR